MNKTLPRIALVVAVAMAGLFSARLTTPVVAQVVAQNATVPYSISYQNILTDPSGKQTELDPHVDAQRRNGDRVQIWPLANGKHKRIIEFVAADLTVSASDINANISTLGRGRAKPLIPNYACLSNQRPRDMVGKESIVGWSTTHYRDSNDSQITDTWVAGPELGCVILKRVVTFLENGNPTSSDSLVATHVVAGDPPEAEFALPANAVEVPPSQFEGSLQSPISGSPATSRLDNIYYSHKAIREASAQGKK